MKYLEEITLYLPLYFKISGCFSNTIDYFETGPFFLNLHFRKLREHQQTSDLDSKGIDAQSKQTQDNRKGGRDTNFQTTQGILKDRDDEYHVYNEIDIKEPSNIEMVYSLAYESFDSN